MIADIIHVILITFGICAIYGIAVYFIEKMIDKRDGGGDP